jgi:O-antigen/teichoic acid export membrane protein
VGNIISGLCAYAFLILAARQLGPARYSALSALWTLVYLIGPGAFLPMEQEICRASVARLTAGKADRPAVVRAAEFGGILAAVLLAGVALASGPLRVHLFEGSATLVVSLALGLVGYYCMHLSWGVLAGHRRFRGYGMVSGSEGLFRLGICAALLPLGAGTLGPYGIAVGLAPLLAAYAGWRAQGVVLAGGEPEPWRPAARAITFLLGASFLRLVVLMIGPVIVQGLAFGAAQRGEAGRYLAALALTRVPLFIFGAVLVALLPRLSHLVAEGGRHAFSGLLIRASVAVAVLTVISCSVADAVGPQLLRMFFGAGYVVAAGDLVRLTAGCGLYLLALLLSYGLIAAGGHGWTTVAWLVGCLTFVALVLGGASLSLLDRVEWGFTLSSAASATTMGAFLIGVYRTRRWSPAPNDQVDLATTLVV